MPFDDRDFPTAQGPEFDTPDERQRRWVAGWLLVVAFMILVMIVLGGATRLTGSGLSIMEWAPLSGILPPLSQHEWQRLFGLYKHIPQYALVNQNFDLAAFQHIFWLEWVHRLWGRLLGLVFLAPLAVFTVRRMIPRALIPRLALLFVLGGLQGAVGWFMVESGFLQDSVAVSAYRLVAHLGLAMALYGAILWTALSLWPRAPQPPAPPLARGLAWIALSLVVLTMLAGGFVAGLHAGLIYNTFPLMDGHLVPDAYAQLAPFARNFTENVATVQFDHRLLATLTAIASLGAAAAGLGLTRRDQCRRTGLRGQALWALGGVVVLQYCLGVMTLLRVVPTGLAVAHQACAVLLLTAALTVTHTSLGRRRR